MEREIRIVLYDNTVNADDILAGVRALVGLTAETYGSPLYIYERDSKIARETILEVTGVKRYPPTPTLSASQIARIEQILGETE